MARVLFMGTPSYALEILKALLESEFEVVGLFTQPDKFVGRKKVLTPPVTKEFLVKFYPGIPIFQPNSLKNESFRDEILALKPDFIVVAAYGQILPKKILEIAPCINLHASILPKYRGASPIQEAILNGEKMSGVTAMAMGEGLDDGDILGFSFLDIRGLKSVQVFDEMARVASNLTLKTLRNFKNINPISQFHALSSKCSKIKKDDGLVKFSDDAREVYKKFLAYNPWPGIFLENGTKILEAKFHSSKSSENLGEISNITKDGFTLNFKNGELEILKLQEISKKPLDAKDFLNGKRLKSGDRIC